MGIFIGLYYGNIWNALQFPFLSQQLFSPASNETLFDVYNQSAILDKNFELDPAALGVQGLPSFAATNASYLLTTNLCVTATLVHIYLYHREAVTSVFTGWRRPDLGAVKQRLVNPRTWFRSSPAQAVATGGMSEEKLAQLDPHYRQMLAYKEVPTWWYLTILVVSTFTALGCIYSLNSTLPWWGFLIATLLSFGATLFFGSLNGLIGFFTPITSVIQLIGGYLHPGQPVANMYFVLFGANSQSQALALIGNLKLGQYGKLSPRCTFTAQTIGTLLGAVVNYALMNSITDNQRDILLSIQGTNIWSGQVIQSFNSNVRAPFPSLKASR